MIAGQTPQAVDEGDAFREAARRDACDAALAAWEAIAHFYKGSYAIVEKSDGPATEADRLADRLIADRLAGIYPRTAYGYLTEESADSAERLTRDRVWIIDPIDGTKDFIKGTGNFAIQIALVERDAAGDCLPVVAVVYRPVAGLMYSAVAGGGAWRHAVVNGRIDPATPPARCRVSDRDALGRLRAVVSNSHQTSRLMRLIQSLGLEDYRHIGSLGVKVCLIAEGAAELYVITSLGMVKEWDSCAPQLILTEAGGKVTDLLGRPLVYNRPDVRLTSGLLASNGPVHGQLSDRAARFLREDGALLE